MKKLLKKIWDKIFETGENESPAWSFRSTSEMSSTFSPGGENMKKEIAEVMLAVAEAKRFRAYDEKRICPVAMEVFLLVQIYLLDAEISVLNKIIKEEERIDKEWQRENSGI